jgi:hypothetical protein
MPSMYFIGQILLESDTAEWVFRRAPKATSDSDTSNSSTNNVASTIQKSFIVMSTNGHGLLQ